MQIQELLEALKDVIDEGKEVPFVKKIVVDGEEILDILIEIKKNLPSEIKQAAWITEERTSILLEANKEAEDIVKEAERRIIEMVDEHEITRQAQEKSLKIIEDAKIQAREISQGTREYADSKLEEAERSILELLERVQGQEDYLEKSLNRLKEDRKALNR